jgi:hypothetical protein
MFSACSFVETTTDITQWDINIRALCVGVTIIMSVGIGIEFLNDTNEK